VAFDELPDVIPDRVLAQFFARTVRSIQMKRANGAWPLPELQGQKCRTSKRLLGRYLDGEQIVRAGRSRRR
jgi:hypothetical protein